MNRDYIIYALYKNGEIIYIGITDNIPARSRQHKRTKDFDFIKPIINELTKEEALFGERLLITFATKFLHTTLCNVIWNEKTIKKLILKKEGEGIYA